MKPHLHHVQKTWFEIQFVLILFRAHFDSDEPEVLQVLCHGHAGIKLFFIDIFNILIIFSYRMDITIRRVMYRDTYPLCHVMYEARTNYYVKVYIWIDITVMSCPELDTTVISCPALDITVMSCHVR